MTEEIKIYVYSSCHFSERLDNDAVGNGGYGVIIISNQKKMTRFLVAFLSQQMPEWTSLELPKGLKK
jgi:hypothetical protein